jgi:predicted phage-related endonuclease
MAGELTRAEKAARRHGLGGSDAGPVFGYGYGTPFSVWCDKVYGAEVEVTPQMQRGHDLEPVVAELFTRKTGEPVKAMTGQHWSTSPGTPWLFATLDYRLRRGGIYRREWLECKTAEWRYAGHEWGPDDSGPDGLPPRYLLQGHHQIAATGAARVIVAVLFVDTWDLRHYVIERDPTIAELLVEGERQFWEDHVLARVPPAISNPARDLEAARAIPVEGGAAQLGEDDRRWLVQWADANAAVTAAEKEKAEAKAELVRLIGTTGQAEFDGRVAVTASYNKHGTRTYLLKTPKQWRTT